MQQTFVLFFYYIDVLNFILKPGNSDYDQSLTRHEVGFDFNFV